jgi:TRAP-type mannitol/chloroaromatic compound transport system substrate-binding protein
MIAAHFTWDEMMVWFFDDEVGGWKQAEDMFAKFGIKWILHTLSVTEQHYSSKRKIVDIKDYKGLTFRGVGWTGMVLQEPEFQASGVMMPTGDIYTALQTGVIEGTELSNPFSNFTMGMHEVTKYAGFPGVHQLTQTSSMMYNMDQFKKLSKDLQVILELAGNKQILRNASFSLWESAKVIPVLRDKFGIEIVTLNVDTQRIWAKVSWRMASAIGAQNAEWKSVQDRMMAMLRIIRPYFKFQTPDFGTEGIGIQ